MRPCNTPPAVVPAPGMNVTTPATNSRTGFAFGQIEQKSPLAGAAAALTEAVIVPPPAAWAAATVRTFAAISIANCFESKGIVFSSLYFEHAVENRSHLSNTCEFFRRKRRTDSMSWVPATGQIRLPEKPPHPRLANVHTH